MTNLKEVDAAISASRSSDELIRNLLELDQLHPGNAVIKAQLGIAYLMSGAVDSADILLSAAEKSTSIFTKKNVKYLIYAGIADVNLKKGRYASVKQYGEKALKVKVSDSLGVQVLIARAEAALGESDAAYDAYQAARITQRRFMNAGDYAFVLGKQADKGNWSQALMTYLEQISTLGYVPGDGLSVSALYEKQGDYSRSLTSAAFELWRLYDEGKISETDARKRLDEVTGKTWSYLDSGSKPRFEGLVRGYKAVFCAQWDDAESSFANNTSENPDCFERYILCVSSFMASGRVHSEYLKSFVDIESCFRNFQPYYCYLWRAMKNGDMPYSFEVVRPIFEKTISLGYETPSAVLTRAEMGRLLGLSNGDADRLIPANGVEDLLQRYYATGDPVFLQPVGDLLSIPNNLYTSECVQLMGRYSGDAMLKRALVASVRSHNALFDIRLADIFGRL